MNLSVISIMQEDVIEKTTGIFFRLANNGNIISYEAGKWAAFPLLRKCRTAKNILDIIPPSRWKLFREAVSNLNKGQEIMYFKFPLVCNKEKYRFTAKIKPWGTDNYTVIVVKLKDNKKKRIYPEYQHLT
jgi:hypothetical protein